jgi:hypothetical protein
MMLGLVLWCAGLVVVCGVWIVMTMFIVIDIRRLLV